MTQQFVTPIDAKDLLGQILMLGTGDVVAVIVGTCGPSYRPIGTLMGITSNEKRIGNLSSGCIDNDIADHARNVGETGVPKILKYGEGSPFFDLKLPCGGGLEVLLVPLSDLTALRAASRLRCQRECFALGICSQTGAMTLGDYRPTGWHDAHFEIGFQPDVRFVTFGKGPEAYAFASLTMSSGFDNMLFSPDAETLDIATAYGNRASYLNLNSLEHEVEIDRWTAVVLFFHDHDWEPPILERALKSDAFYIGAQGSRRTSETRRQALKEIGFNTTDTEKIKGPIGLVPSARDASTLAVSVLAEVLSELNWQPNR